MPSSNSTRTAVGNWKRRNCIRPAASGNSAPRKKTVRKVDLRDPHHQAAGIAGPVLQAGVALHADADP
jgi:hypothetical protein